MGLVGQRRKYAMASVGFLYATTLVGLVGRRETMGLFGYCIVADVDAGLVGWRRTDATASVGF